MSKIWLQLILASAIIFHMGYADAKVLKSSDTSSTPSGTKASKSSAAPEDPKKREARRKLIEEKKAELNGTSWDIEIRSQSGKGGLSGPDQLVFQDGRFSSKNASKLGFPPTNYTLTVHEDEKNPTTWETMQISEKEGIAFWRGEWQKDTMSGVITRQLKKGNEDYYFSSSKKENISPTSVKESEGEKKKSVGEFSEPPAETGPESVLLSSVAHSAETKQETTTKTTAPAKTKKSVFI